MKANNLIVNLIQQDLKHHQLISGLEGIGLSGGDIHCLRILEIVADLMNVPKGKLKDRWSNVYLYHMEEAIHYDITSRGEELRPLAERCYKQLVLLLGGEE